MNRKRLLSLGVSIALLAAILTGCHSPAPDAAVPTSHNETLPPQTAALPSETVTEPPALHRLPSVEELVIPAVTEFYAWDDSVGNRNEVTVRLPHIHSDEPFAADYNARIDDLANQIISEVEASVQEASSTFLVSVDYEAWLNEDVLSIVITTQTSIECTQYRVDNFDLDDREYMTTADMCDEYLDMAYPQFLKLTHDMILRDFEAKYGDVTAQFSEEVAFIRELFETDAFIARNRKLYLNENGALMLVYDRPSIAGAAYYSTIGEMTVEPALVPSEADAWNWLFDLFLRASDETKNDAAELLRIAFSDEKDDFLEALTQRPDKEANAIKAAVGLKYKTEG